MCVSLAISSLLELKQQGDALSMRIQARTVDKNVRKCE
jgi:hypothetical protein